MGIRSFFGGDKDKDREEPAEESGQVEEQQDQPVPQMSTDLDQDEPRPVGPARDDEEIVSNVASQPPVDESMEGDDEVEEAEEAPRKHTLKIRPRTAQELFLDAIPERARFAGQNLKSHLTGRIRFVMKPSGAPYTIDWSGSDLKAVEGAEGDAACTIDISEADLMRIVAGELNPQVAMLSHKVRIQGSAEHASYVFNLIAPTNNSY